MCWPQRGHGVHARLALLPTNPAAAARAPCPRASRLRASDAAPASCGCSHTSCMSLTCAFAICASSSRASTCSAVRGAKASTMIARSASRGRAATRIAREALVLSKLGPQQYLVAERGPFALVLQAEHHDLAVAGGERAVGVDRGVARAGARRRLPRRRSRSTADSSSIRRATPASRCRCAGRVRSAADA